MRSPLAILLLATVVQAEVRLNGLFTDNMVLQRDQPIPIWGHADPGANVTVEFSGQKKTDVVDADGNWIIVLDPLTMNTAGRELLVRSSIGNQTSKIRNVLVGDVWLCAGQSNMQQEMRQYLIWDREKNSFSNDQIRLFKIKAGGVGASAPTKEIVVDPFFDASWRACSPEFAAVFSATAGFFARKLQRDTGAPIGLISANRGGTRANMWIPRKVMERKTIYAPFLDASNPEWTEHRGNPGAIRAPAHLYNGTIHPLAPFAIKGVIWYQGESDAPYSNIYAEMMSDLVAAWRSEWGYDFPFLYTQIAPWDRVAWDRVGEAWAWQREAQLNGLETIPNSGMAVITDGGEAVDIHPQAKDLPGERLAMLAAALDDASVDADVPIMEKNIRAQAGKALVRFRGISGGLETRRVALNIERGALPGEGADAVVAEADEVKGFTIAGAEGNFVAASAKLVSKDTVLVWADAVREPVAVRYGWSNFPLCNLYGGNGMPASPGRTDDFPRPNFTGEILAEDFDAAAPEQGAEMEWLNAGDGAFETAEIGGVLARKASGSYLYAKVAFNEPKSATIRVVYLDEGFGTIQLRYDSTSDEIFAGKRSGVWKPAGEVKLKNSGRWKVVAFDLPDGKFAKRCNGGDVRLQSTGRLIAGNMLIQEK